METDGEALVRRIAAMRGLLLRSAQRWIRNRDDAEDAAQDAILSALVHLDGYRGGAEVEAWLRRIAANAALMAVRRERRITARTVRALSLLPSETNWLRGALLEGQDAQLERAGAARLLRDAIAALPAPYRAVITQCDLDERPIDRVAARLGISSAGVRTRRRRAISLLRAQLANLDRLA